MREQRITLEASGFSLVLCSWGPEAGPPVVLLHGLLDQGASWGPVAQVLAAQGYRVLAPDQRGHGRSDHVGPGGYYHFADYLRDLDGLLNALNLPSCVLVGHSMGATVASMYAGACPDRVTHLAVIDGLGPPVVSQDDAAARLRRHLVQLRAPPEAKPLASLQEAVSRLRHYTPNLSLELATTLAERGTTTQDGTLRWGWDALHRTRAPVAYDRGRHMALLRRILAPTLLVVGSRGWYPALPDLELRAEAISRLERLDLPTSHAVHIDAPRPLAAAILRLMESSNDWGQLAVE